jgi:hypothetical protein
MLANDYSQLLAMTPARPKPYKDRDRLAADGLEAHHLSGVQTVTDLCKIR